MSSLAQLLNELKEDPESGDAALAGFRYNFDDLYAVFGKVEGEEIRTKIYPLAERAREASARFQEYMGRVKSAKKADITHLETFYTSKLKSLAEEVAKLEQEGIELAAGLSEKEIAIESEYAKRMEELRSYLVQQKNRQAEAQKNVAVILASIGLNEKEETYIRDLRQRIRQSQLERRSRLTKLTRKGPAELPIEKSEFAGAPTYQAIAEKIDRKDAAGDDYRKNIEEIALTIFKYETELNALGKEMNTRIENLINAVTEDVERKDKEIENLEAEYSIFDGQYKVELDKVESAAIDLEKRTRDQFLNYHLRLLAQQEIEQKLESSAVSLTSQPTEDSGAQ